MDWLWTIYQEHVTREVLSAGRAPEDLQLLSELQTALGESSATLYVMEPVGGTIRFKGLGRWSLAEVPDLVADPNAFIAENWGGGKFKVNFHRRDTFIGTHNFRTWGDERWRACPEVDLEA